MSRCECEGLHEFQEFLFRRSAILTMVFVVVGVFTYPSDISGLSFAFAIVSFSVFASLWLQR